MGQKQTKLFLHYYEFQKTIKEYLSDWNNKKDCNKLEKGYIIHPDWIKEWKSIINYNNLKNNLEVQHHNINNIEEKIIKQDIKLSNKEYKKTLINYIKINDLKYFPPFSDSFISLEYLQNFCDEETYKLFKTNVDVQEMEYIFKKRMLIIFCKIDSIIKIIMFHNKNIINLRIFCNDKNRFDVFKKYFKIKNSDEIMNYITNKDIYNKKEYTSKENNITYYTLNYEEEKNNLNILNPQDIIKNRDIENDINITNANNNNIFNNNNFNINLNNGNNQSENSLQINNINKIENNNNNISQLNIENIEINKNENKFPLLPEDNITIYIKSSDGKINTSIDCKKNAHFSSIEEKLYNKYPEIKDKYLFLGNGGKINRNQTIKDETNIMMYDIDDYSFDNNN